MNNLILELEQQYKKPWVVTVRSGDTVKVTQRIKEANRERLQVFEGLVLRVRRRNSLTYSILVRKLASGIAVEKNFMMHAPNTVRVEVVKRAKVRRNYLSYMRRRVGKAARLQAVPFNRQAVNNEPEVPPTPPVKEPADKTSKAAVSLAKPDSKGAESADKSEATTQGVASKSSKGAASLAKSDSKPSSKGTDSADKATTESEAETKEPDNKSSKESTPPAKSAAKTDSKGADSADKSETATKEPANKSSQAVTSSTKPDSKGADSTDQTATKPPKSKS